MSRPTKETPLEADARLGRAVARAVEGAGGPGAGGVSALVCGGSVILEGEVPFDTVSADVEAAVHTVAGVVSVENRLRIAPEPALLWEAREAIERALGRRAARE